MPILLRGNRLSAADQSVTAEQVAELVTKHLNTVWQTRALEERGQQLAHADFPADAVIVFVKDVCAWGGYYFGVLCACCG